LKLDSFPLSSDRIFEIGTLGLLIALYGQTLEDLTYQNFFIGLARDYIFDFTLLKSGFICKPSLQYSGDKF
jgi:hypothetical protein